MGCGCGPQPLEQSGIRAFVRSLSGCSGILPMGVSCVDAHAAPCKAAALATYSFRLPRGRAQLGTYASMIACMHGFMVLFNA